MTTPSPQPATDALYFGDIHATDPLTKEPVRLTLYLDRTSSGVFAVDDSYVDANMPVHSPFSGQRVQLGEQPPAEGVQTLGHPEQQKVIDTVLQKLRTILRGSNHDGRWLDEHGTECDEDDPGAEWHPFTEEEQGQWLETVCDEARAALQEIGKLTGRDEASIAEADDPDDEMAAGGAPVAPRPAA